MNEAMLLYKTLQSDSDNSDTEPTLAVTPG
jgi:hypothetical protein